MAESIELTKVTGDILSLKNYWNQRNIKFKEWYEYLILVDSLASKGMESYVSNEPQTFYNMAHYLLAQGKLSHTTPISTETAMELDRRARVHRGCEYLWKMIDRDRQLGGSQSFIDELSFFLLVLGWYSAVFSFDQSTGLLQADIWSPYETYPKYLGGKMAACVHSYKILEEDVVSKAAERGWNYTRRGTVSGEVVLDDYYVQGSEGIHNMILIDSKDVTGWVHRPEMMVLASPVAGFPDKGSLTPIKSKSKADWRKLTGRGIFEVNETVFTHFNKWKSQIAQVLRDTVQPITQEFSSNPQATPEQLRERGALFHYAPGEAGLQRVTPAAIPIEIQANLLELHRERQKGSFSDAVYGMVEGQPGYALSLLASSSANQILYPYMDGKHFVVSEADRFWLSNLKRSRRVFEIKGKFIEKLHPTDIPEDVSIQVESDVATPKDWLERGTVANMLEKHLDETTIVTEILKMSDPQEIKRRRSLDRMLNHPMSQLVEMISGYYVHADYLKSKGDSRQSALFKRAAQSLETQLGQPAPGQAKPEEMSRVQAERTAGAPAERTRVAPEVLPPEARGGFTPQELRRSLGRGTVRVP